MTSRIVKARPPRRRFSVVNDKFPFVRVEGKTINEARPKRRNSAPATQDTDVFLTFTSLCCAGEALQPMGKVNQDDHVEIPNFDGNSSNRLFIVMDGHGVNGHLVSKMLKERLPPLFLAEWEKNPVLKPALASAFRKMNEELINSSIDCSLSGSTCTLVLILQNTIYTANVGDSRVIVGSFRNGKWSAKPLSDDHKPNRPDEWDRIVEAGGRIEPLCCRSNEFIGPPRVWLPSILLPGLAMSRSMGDTIAASVGVSSEPEFVDYTLSVDDKFIILATDGVWEFLSNDEAVEIVTPFYIANDIERACDNIVKESFVRWETSEGAADDITCTIIFIKHSKK
ncbi:protein phosphatase 2c containing protein [Cardiosporidium cionae]|uniref:Protein phosphatase 2c containing protein n=1 Tax=Cardiosporidium cionae TaxID=476202 RepID=A0ABQ7JB71_9APIC|nr:protein phosphatase 2c containing protein [Cardiosporidium cionae]|eukprot:KAF8821247.1 protein phosphatase 2c containing protein [Cardiosporidium cionae]